jgi:hypothetical protein
MEINKRKLAISFFMIVLYLIIINLSVYVLSISFDVGNNYSYYDDGSIRLGMSDSVSVEVVRNRIYGTIKISGDNEVLYLFGIIPVPLEIGGLKYSFVHLIFLSFIIYFNFKKQKVYKEDKPYYDYEKLVD